MRTIRSLIVLVFFVGFFLILMIWFYNSNKQIENIVQNALLRMKASHGQQQAIFPDNQSTRLDLIHRICAEKQNHREATNLITYNEKTNLAYCYLPKCGSTFWKRIFRFLDESQKLNSIKKSPFDIEREIIHKENTGKKQSDDFFKDKYTFIFVRNPYSRLWSAYLDKFFLPNFWVMFGKMIVAARESPKVSIPNCYHDISFEEFIEYVLDESTPDNEHWKPMVLLCDPCVIQPTFLGKIETFSADMGELLHSAGLLEVVQFLKGSSYSANVIENEVTTLIDTYYKHSGYKSTSEYKCISQSDLNQRIWTLFQLNGYIPKQISFNPIIPRNESEIRTHILKTIKNRTTNKTMLKHQKQQALVEAFKSLPKHLLVKIPEKYKDDFEMFGYDPKPKEIFD